jgi:outer membrane protein OmpA-like peptidoglycan-associated protein
MKHVIRSALFAGTALAAVATGMPQDAAAQSQMPGFFGSLSGWYYFDGGDNRDISFKGGMIEDPFNNPKGGPGGKIYLGYRFNGPIDLAVGAQGTWLGTRKFASESRELESLKTKAHYWAVDGEVGFNTIVAGLAVRLFAGPRYAQFTHQNKALGLSLDGQADISIDQRFTGIGPRIGTDFSARIGNSNFSIFGDAAGSLLFGKLRTKVSVSSPPCPSDCSGSESESRRVWNLEGQLGVGYEVAPNVTIGAGYRAEYWRHVAEIATNNSRVLHGPFVRVAYNFGAPSAMPMAAVVPPPAQGPVVGKTFIVFFDFDRSNITAEGQKTINDAVAAAKAGNSTRITLTGHTDRSGSESYNQALSIRRGEAVKAAMIRAGIPANAIVVVGRGESQNLVPTADGVREPQNRRVEIVI